MVVPINESNLATISPEWPLHIPLQMEKGIEMLGDMGHGCAVDEAMAAVKAMAAEGIVQFPGMGWVDITCAMLAIGELARVS